MIGHLYGPISCKRHDAYLLRRSELHDKLSIVLAAFPIDYLCYGDAAYPVQRYIKRGVKRVRNPGEADVVNVANNLKMSKVRECVEWGFGKIVNMWAFLDFKKNLQIHSSPVATYYTVMANVTNCHTCLYGGQTASFFECIPPTIEEYLL
jgi:nuclease HARBI1